MISRLSNITDFGLIYMRVVDILKYHLSQQSGVLDIGQTDIDLNLTAVRDLS